MKKLWDERYQPADHAIIKRKAARFARKNRETMTEEDLAQDLALRVIQQADRCNPARGPRDGFVGMVAHNHFLNLRAARHAEKRDDRRNVTYDEAPEHAMNDGCSEQQVDLQIEMKALAASLSTELREVLELMLAGHCEADLQRHLHLSRRRVRTLVEQLTQLIRERKLHEYLDYEQPNRGDFLS